MDFEADREANIARNRAMLESLGLLKDNFITIKRSKPLPKASKSKKRKHVVETEDTASEKSDDEVAVKPAKKVAAVEPQDTADGSGPRRSSRNTGKKVDYAGDGDNLGRAGVPQLVTERARKAAQAEGAGAGLRVKDRKHDPKTYGAIPGVPVGKWWETREACSIDAIHAPFVAGISCGPDGCYSVALSGGYEDDVDLGEAFTYTGSGGRDLKGTKHAPKNLRTAPQSSDQTFESPFNAALLKSVETRKPVRVIRGYKLHSRYAPAEGYRYDGLYTVEKAWREKGLNPKGYLVCKFALKRIPGQPPIPVYEDEVEESNDAASETDIASRDAASETAVASPVSKTDE